MCMFLASNFNGLLVFSASLCTSTMVNFLAPRVKVLCMQSSSLVWVFIVKSVSVGFFFLPWPRKVAWCHFVFILFLCWHGHCDVGVWSENCSQSDFLLFVYFVSLKFLFSLFNPNAYLVCHHKPHLMLTCIKKLCLNSWFLIWDWACKIIWGNAFSNWLHSPHTYLDMFCKCPLLQFFMGTVKDCLHCGADDICTCMLMNVIISCQLLGSIEVLPWLIFSSSINTVYMLRMSCRKDWFCKFWYALDSKH